MSETAKRGRRWPRMVLAIAVAVIGVPLGWKFRPLNAHERGLVGTWKFFSPSDRTRIGKLQLRADRTYLIDGAESGTWSANSEAISLRFPVGVKGLPGMTWPDRLYYFVKYRMFPPSYDLQRFSPDCWSGADCTTILRSSDPTPPSADQSTSP